MPPTIGAVRPQTDASTPWSPFWPVGPPVIACRSGRFEPAASAGVPSQARRHPLPLRPAGRRHRTSDPCLDRPRHRGTSARVRRAGPGTGSLPCWSAAHVLAHDRRGRSTATAARSGPFSRTGPSLRPSQGGHQRPTSTRRCGRFSGNQRHNLIKALRSLFRLAKKNGLVFGNPTSGFEEPTSRPGPAAHHR